MIVQLEDAFATSEHKGFSLSISRTSCFEKTPSTSTLPRLYWFQRLWFVNFDGCVDARNGCQLEQLRSFLILVRTLRVTDQVVNDGDGNSFPTESSCKSRLLDSTTRSFVTCSFHRLGRVPWEGS
jgi:hypothetical protein